LYAPWLGWNCTNLPGLVVEGSGNQATYLVGTEPGGNAVLDATGCQGLRIANLFVAQLEGQVLAEVGGKVIKCPSPLNVLKDTAVHTIIAVIEHVKMDISTYM
jgi:hypothetical protein